MAARIEVNAETVRTYLDRAMTRENYHLMYGLHLLSKDRCRGVMDALINGDLLVAGICFSAAMLFWLKSK